MSFFDNAKVITFAGKAVKKLELDGKKIWEAIAYKNWVRYSTESDDKTIYNGGLGYKVGYRVRSGGGEAEFWTATCTGYIKVMPGDSIRIYGADCSQLNVSNAINVFNKNFEAIGQIVGNSLDTGYGIFNSTWKKYNWSAEKGPKQEVSGAWYWRIPFEPMIAYIRVTGHTTDGANLKVTINEKEYSYPQLLPSEYQKVEYISAAQQVEAYIDLGFSFDTKATIFLDQIINNATPQVYGYVFGAAEQGGVYRCMLTSPYDINATFYGSTGSDFWSVSAAFVNNDINNFTMLSEPDFIYMRNTHEQIKTGDYRTTNATFIMTNNLYLFAQNYNGTPRFGAERTIKSFRYYDKTDTVICNLVPCYRKSDGVIGMYDTVRNLFLTNIGTGSFTKGPNV